MIGKARQESEQRLMLEGWKGRLTSHTNAGHLKRRGIARLRAGSRGPGEHLTARRQVSVMSGPKSNQSAGKPADDRIALG